MLMLHTRRRLAGLAAAASVVSLVLTGCSLVPQPAPAVSTSAAAGFENLYGQKVTWTSCERRFECATVTAPVNWDAAADGTISLALVRHRATGQKLGSLLVNPGGPGGSGVGFVVSGSSVTSALGDAYDIVGWDPRGVGKSTEVTCFTDPKQTDRALYGTFSSPYGTQGWIDELTVAEKSFAAACNKNTGKLLAHVDAISNAKDMDLIRGLLGDAKLNYLGYSYGTFLGTVYAELFPDKVGRLVLDGAIDPLLGSLDQLAVQMAGFDNAFRAYMAWCLARTDCPFNGTVDNALAQARSVLDGVNARRFINSDGRELDSATLGTAVAANLYSRSLWPDQTAMFAALRKSDPSLAFASADSYNSRNSDGTYEGNSTEVYIAVNCLEGDFASDPTTALGGVAKIDAAAPILGKYFAYDDYAVLEVACTNWPVPPVTMPAAYDAKGAAPILVVGTTNDPATPLAWARSLASQLSSGVLVTRNGEGHTAYNRGNACIDATVDDYFVKGTVPSVDPMC
jgi:pimeloyl-ACP methyl ester carboxylesterase